MNEDVIGNASFGGDVDPILPDGWKPGDDFFALADAPETPAELTADGQSNDDEFLTAMLKEEDAQKPALTMDEQTAEEPSAEMEAAPTAEEPSPVAEKKTSRILKAKVNHDEFEFDVNDTPDSDIISWRQKADAYDKMREANAKKAYRDTYKEQVDAGMSEGVAKLVAAAAADGKTFSLTDDDPEVIPPVAVKTDGRMAELQNELKAMKARLNDMIRQNNETVAAYQKENKILKQNAAAAASSPVKPVSGGGDVTPPKKDLMLEAFDSATPW